MTGNDQPIAVALDDATVAFRVAGDRVYTAVQQASLSVADGEFVAIVGPTGCGKSTLLNVAAGLFPPGAVSFAAVFGYTDRAWLCSARLRRSARTRWSAASSALSVIF